MSLLRPLEIKTTSLLRPVFSSPKWNFPYDLTVNIKTTSLIRPLLDSPKGGLNIGILLYMKLHTWFIPIVAVYYLKNMHIRCYWLLNSCSKAV